MVLLLCGPGVSLEPVVAVGIAAAHELPERAGGVDEGGERAEHELLRDVPALVLEEARAPGGRAVAVDDHGAPGEGSLAARAKEPREGPALARDEAERAAAGVAPPGAGQRHEQ